MVNSSDEKFMRLAIAKAREGIAAGGLPFGSCIVRQGQVLACEHGYVQINNDPTAHAEITAIRAAARKIKNFDLSGSTIYSTTEPCPMCFAACHWAGIKRILFGTDLAQSRKFFTEMPIGSQQMNELGLCKIEITGGVLLPEDLRLWQEWSQRQNKKPIK